MDRQLKFRHRIGLLVALAALALAGVTAVTLVLGWRSERELTGIETRYVPLLELDRDVKTTFAQLVRALESAADAADDGRLDDADRLARQLIERLREGRAAIADNGGDAAALEHEVVAYYAIAREVAAALIAQLPASHLEAKIEAMRRAQHALTGRLDAATAPDRRRLAATFAAARRSHEHALRIVIAVAIGALAGMALLSWRLTRRTVRALHEVAAGVQRLARGEFGHEIEVVSGDELGELAREANRTAARLRDYRERADALLRETQHQAEQLRRARDTVEARNASLVATQQLLEHRAAELERVSATLRDKNADLENISQTLSHDLRAPLRSIRGFSQILAESLAGKLDGDDADALDRVLRGSERMAGMLDDLYRLLRLSSAEAASGSVDVAAVLDDVSENLRSDLDQSGAVISRDALPTVRGSATLLGQVLQNLIANAIRFRGADPPAIHVGATELADAWQLSVRDNGIGIAPDARDRVFRLFERLSSDGAGTGVGLALCKRAVEKLGGRIWVEPAPGPGTTFCFTIPRPPAIGEPATA